MVKPNQIKSYTKLGVLSEPIKKKKWMGGFEFWVPRMGKV